MTAPEELGEAWFAALASATVVVHPDAGVLILDPRSGRIVASSARAEELVGAPVPERAADLVEAGLIARPDADAFRRRFAGWRADRRDPTAEEARSWTGDLRVHPPDQRTRTLRLEVVHHIRPKLDREAVIIVIRPVTSADGVGEPADEVGGTHWDLYDATMCLIALDPRWAADLDVLPTPGVPVSTTVAPEEIERLVPVVTQLFVPGSRLNAVHYTSYIPRAGRSTLRFDTSLRVVTGSGEAGSPDRRVLVMTGPGRQHRDAILASDLTPRQTAVVVATFAGARPQQIADDLGLGLPTVRTHLAAAYRRLGVSGRDELVASYHPPGQVDDQTTVTVVEEGGKRFPEPAGPPGMTGSTERRRLRGADGEVEVAVTTWAKTDDARRPIPDGLLTERETDVVRALLDGLRPTAIATSKNVSVKTVRNQLAAAYAKLQVSGQADLLRTYRLPASPRT